VRTAFNGKKVSVFRDGTEEYDIWVQLDQSFRQNQADLASLFIFTPTGELVRLSEIASVESGPSYGSIRHVDTNRAITISGDAFRLPGPVLVRLVQKALTGFELPEGISMRFTGENEDRKETQKVYWAGHDHCRISDSFSDDRPIQFNRSSSDCDHIRVHVDHGGVDWIDCS